MVSFGRFLRRSHGFEIYSDIELDSLSFHAHHCHVSLMLAVGGSRTQRQHKNMWVTIVFFNSVYHINMQTLFGDIAKNHSAIRDFMVVLRFSSSLLAGRRGTNAGSKSLVACAKLRRTQPSLGVAPTTGRLSFACPASFNVILVIASTCFLFVLL